MKPFLLLLPAVLLAVLLAPLATALFAEDPAGFGQWTDAQLKDIAKNIKVDQTKAGNNRFANYGNHSIMEVRREGDGEAEVHDTQADIMVITSGSGDLILGGTVVEGRNTGNGETRGKSITGGTTKKLAVGDVVHVPAKIPHQVLTHGKNITYVVVKVDSK